MSSEVRGIGVRSDAGVSACALLHEEEHQRTILSSVGSGCHDTATLGGALGSVDRNQFLDLFFPLMVVLQDARG